MDTINILKKLICIPSYVSETNSEYEISKYILQYLRLHTKLRIETQLVEKNRRNIIAYSNLKPDIIFFGHMDTVLPNTRTKNPFTAVKKDGKIFGLGAVDMKAGLAIMLSIANKYRDSNSLAYVFTVDEEYEFKGACKFIEKYDFKPKYIVNLEPTDLKILNGCRGVTEFTFDLYGKSSHAGTKHLGINAIEKSIKLSNLLQKDISRLNVNIGLNSLNLAYLNGGIKDSKELVTYSGNVVPDYARCVFEIRIANPVITTDYIKNKMNEIASALNIKITDIKFKFLVGTMYTPKSDLKVFEKVLKSLDLKVQYANINKTGYFEVQLLNERFGGNVIVFGPGPSLAAHHENEYVDIDTIEKTQKVMEAFIKKLGAE